MLEILYCERNGEPCFFLIISGSSKKKICYWTFLSQIVCEIDECNAYVQV
jgi:hypothetical protein